MQPFSSQAASGRHQRPPLRVLWLTKGLPAALNVETATSTLATHRYRVLLPARALRARGWDITWANADEIDRMPPARPDILVLGKLLQIAKDETAEAFDASAERALALAREQSARGTKVVADFNDNHFVRPSSTGDYARRAAELADLCIASTESMAAIVTAYTRAAVKVIGDPVASPRRQPHVIKQGRWIDRWKGSPVEPLRLVWYGHPSNFAPLIRWLERLASVSREVPWVCMIVTTAIGGLSEFLQSFNQRHAPHAELTWIDWSEAAQWQAVADAAIVLVPSDTTSETHKVKSTNRVVDALHAGRFVIASPIPAYERFGSWISLSDAPEAAAREYMDQPEAALLKIELGQRFVDRHFNPEAIGDLWEAAFRDVARSGALANQDV